MSTLSMFIDLVRHLVHFTFRIHYSHIHVFKYEQIKYSSTNLAYTRIGIDDSTKNSLYFQHCRLPNARTSCFHILKERNEQLIKDNCYHGKISLEEIVDHAYTLNESIITAKMKRSRVLMSKTNNFMPHFVDNFMRYIE